MVATTVLVEGSITDTLLLSQVGDVDVAGCRDRWGSPPPHPGRLPTVTVSTTVLVDGIDHRHRAAAAVG